MSDIASHRLVVFGASGFAGGKIVDELRRRGHDVVGVARTDAIRRARPDLRIGVVGGAGSLRTATGELLSETATFPQVAFPEAAAQAAALAHLRANSDPGDWFYLSPSATIGKRAEIEPVGYYRVGVDELLVSPEGRSAVAGDDYAVAFVDEIEQPRRHRSRFTAGQ